MADRQSRSGTSIVAAVLILGLTTLFAVFGVDLARGAIDASSIDRAAYLSSVGLGLSPEATKNLLAITAVIVLGLCTLTLILGIGVLRRRAGVREAAIGTFVVFAALTIPMAVVGILSEDPARGSVFGLGIGLADAGVVALLLHPRTAGDFDRAEAMRRRAREARRAARVARRARRVPGASERRG